MQTLIRLALAYLVLPSLPFSGEGLLESADFAGLALVFAPARAIEEF
jgi:hypothetical protein